MAVSVSIYLAKSKSSLFLYQGLMVATIAPATFRSQKMQRPEIVELNREGTF
jgi:hypothetical protein